LQFHPSHGEWIKLLGAAGFVVDALHELYAAARAATHSYYALAAAQWAAQWPVEELWVPIACVRRILWRLSGWRKGVHFITPCRPRS
jgi:hypothetical protein